MPVLENQKTERVPVTMTPRQKAVLARIADSEGENLAATVRRLIREEAARRGLSGANHRERVLQ